MRAILGAGRADDARHRNERHRNERRRIGEPGRKLHKRMLANRAHLFVFMSNRAVPCTNNVSERHLRPSVIFRKVTNGFRCEWGAETYAAFRSVVSTAKANRASVLDAVRFVISAKRSGEAPADLQVGGGLFVLHNVHFMP